MTVIIDCTDQAAAKIAMILHARTLGVPMLLCGGAGGKTDPLALRAGDLSAAVNDALLAKLKSAYPQFLEGIRKEKALTPDLEATLKKALDEVTKSFA